ncbi:MAG: bifunctional UDP-N-acetylglucosamine diphosphorylase/glucosamine-1-phosphate N-acetyltransferase GlmU [Candidatus Binataceae bacterium]
MREKSLMAETSLAAIVLAAGLGTRMRSKRAKVLHQIGGSAMLARVIRALERAGAAPIVAVTGFQAREVEAAARTAAETAQIAIAIQPEQRGTGDAARAGIGALPPDYDGDVLIAYGDMPMLSAATLGEFLGAHRKSGAALSFISVVLNDGGAYGRVLRDAQGTVRAIVEARDASAAERAVREINTGIYLARASVLRAALAGLKPKNAQNEFYLTDIAASARAGGLAVEAWRAPDAAEFAGVNSREELASMETQLREQVNRRLMAAGVTFVDPASAYISDEAEIAADVIIGPNVQILGRCRIGADTRIEGTAWLKDIEIGERCHIKLGVRAEDCRIGADSEIGPFANLRAGTELEGHNRIGNFVETKKAKIGRGTKASHLSYLGDATIGRDTNVGCGVITVNYDGYEKHRTQIGDRCMIGCDTQLVAPVKVGSDVYVASGTTIIREVPDGALVMSHHPQREKSGWMAAWRKRHGDAGSAAGSSHGTPKTTGK